LKQVLWVKKKKPQYVVGVSRQHRMNGNKKGGLIQTTFLSQ